MTHVLVIYYSQSGEVEKAANLFAAQLQASGASVTFEAVRPRDPYPYPWKSIGRFFDAMPDCILGQAPHLETPDFDPKDQFDLVVVVYPVWFLSPALPIQGFFNSAHAAVLKKTDVITISVSRAMWHSATMAMKKLLKSAAAVHRQNIAVTHRGSPLLTLISTPRAMLFGKRDRFMGIFPRSGVSDDDMARLTRLGQAAATRLVEGGSGNLPALQTEPAVVVKRWLVVPELVAWYWFYGWARIIRCLGSIHGSLRTVSVYCFALFLVCLILIGLPVTLLGTLLIYPVIKYRLNTYINRLETPTGGP